MGMSGKAAAVVLALASFAQPDRAHALNTQRCLSEDNHVYLIVTTNSSNIGTQVTSVALNSDGSCSLSEIGAVGDVLTAFSSGPGPLLPDRMRTTVLSGFDTNAINCATNFDPTGANGAGLLNLPLPAGGTVSVDPAFTTYPLVPVTTADANVPAAVDLIMQSRTIIKFGNEQQCSGDLMAFPVGGVGNTVSNATAGEIDNQSITFDDTSGSRVGNGPPGPTSTTPSQVVGPDGFLLQGNCGVSPETCQIIVFTASQDGATTYGVGAAGFTVDAAGVLVQTEGAQTNEGFTPFTPTRTPTSTKTATFTRTATPTNTMTKTASPTVPNTPTTTSTLTRTRTPTAARTPTATRRPSTTRTTTATPRPTSTRTATKTPTATRAPSTPTATRSATPSRTSTRTATASRTRTPSRTRTVTKTATGSRSPSPTPTATPSACIRACCSYPGAAGLVCVALLAPQGALIDFAANCGTTGGDATSGECGSECTTVLPITDTTCA